MQEKVRGIVIHTIAHTDKSIICSIFLQQHGLRSFIVRRGQVRSKSSSNVVQPLNCVTFQTVFIEGKSLNSIKDISLAGHYSAIPFDPIKAMVALFINELLHRTIERDYANEELYTFLEQAISLLDQETTVRNYPLWFVLSLSRIYGFDPAANLQSALFSFLRNNHLVPEGLEQKLVQASYSELREMSIPGDIRRRLLSDSVHYLMSNLGNPRELNSLPVLFEILRG